MRTYHLSIKCIVPFAGGSDIKLVKYSGDPDQRLTLTTDGGVISRGLAKAQNGPLVMIIRATQFVNEAFTQVSRPEIWV